MVHQIINFRNLVVIAVAVIFGLWSTTSCYYDNEEELYPNPPTCDTTNITYSGTVAPILEINCNTCHNSVNQQGGIITDNYDDLQTVINNGSFRGAINHLDGYSPMPQGGEKLNECDLTQINFWLDNGAPNN
jgi:hypothetical protein